MVRHGAETLLVEVTEVEAYLSHKDPASHAFKGQTPRNWAMFEGGGTCYVYLSYGINFCMNVSAQPPGVGEAVLLRAAAPVHGTAGMLARRGMPVTAEMIASPPRQLLNGPGKLCQALGIDLSYNGLDFFREDLRIVDLGKSLSQDAIGTSGRIGISKAKEETLRFFLRQSPWLSRPELKSGRSRLATPPHGL